MHEFSLLIADWYRQNKRDLPWRNTVDPYFIWLSEIILQQTRVDQGLSYYEKFKTNYPNVQTLAEASEQQVLNDWQGLGYYSRARNLKSSAAHIHEVLDGKFPDSFEEIRKLKGVGPYTAAAIASFAFGEKVAVVDGNVYRVLARFFNITTPIDSTEGIKQFQELADELISEKNPGEHNQAIMEFGALQCAPKNPNCHKCALAPKCEALRHKTVEQLPVKKSKTRIRNRFFHYALFKTPNEIVVTKREAKDIWQHLYEFPLLEVELRLAPDEIIEQLELKFGKKVIKFSTEYKHILSHQHLYTRFFHFDEIPQSLSANSISIADLEDYPLPRLIDKYLKENH